MKPPTGPVTHIRLTKSGDWIPAKPIDGGVHFIYNQRNHWYRWDRIVQTKTDPKVDLDGD